MLEVSMIVNCSLSARGVGHMLRGEPNLYVNIFSGSMFSLFLATQIPLELDEIPLVSYPGVDGSWILYN